jgi:hypothetical protein
MVITDESKQLIRWYISDGKQIYYRSEVLEGIDFKTFKSMEVVNNSPSRIAIDKRGIFEGSTRWTEKDYNILLSNVLDSKGMIRNKSKANMKWIKAFNKLIEDSPYAQIKTE